ncbi:MAG: HEAT repeat domain-containing protein [Edaphobacter sp.]
MLLNLSLALLGQEPASEVQSAQAVLHDGVESKDWTVRVQAIQALGLIGPNEALRKHLEQFLSDGNVNVRIATIKTLADLKSTASIPALQKTMKEDNTPEVSLAAAKALYAMHNEAGKTWLLDVYAGKEKGASSALESQKRKFMGNFHSLESTGTFIVTSGIGYVPVPGMGQGFSAVMGLLADPDLSPRASCLLLLSPEKNQQTTELLKQGLQDKDWSVRASAAQAIAYTARARLREALVPLFTDKAEKVRFRAAGAYLHLALLNPRSSAASFE